MNENGGRHGRAQGALEGGARDQSASSGRATGALGSRSRAGIASVALAWALLASASVALQVVGCASGGPPEPPRMCLEVEAGSRLNYFSGKSHLVVLYVYPLSNSATFSSMSARALLDGRNPSGMTEDERRMLEISPGQQLELEDLLPRDTLELGLVADFRDEPKKAVVSAECGLFGGAKVLLSANDLQVQP